jgi:hypothetical protein
MILEASRSGSGRALGQGVDPFAINENKLSATQVAKSSGNEAIADLFLEHVTRDLEAGTAQAASSRKPFRV